MDSETPIQESMFSSEDSRVRTTRFQDTVRDWLATVALCGGSSLASLTRSAPHGLSARTYLGSSVAEVVGTLQRSSTALPNAGMAQRGLCLMLSTSEFRNGAAASSLSDILEESPDPKYFLSARACTGILRRSERRVRQLPDQLRKALEEVVERSE